MIEKVKKVSNPLTIIAIFAALAEIASTVALVGVGGETQKLFVWFVMLFPCLLVVLFFLTLNFNSKALYAPSDFRDEENFVRLIERSGTLASQSIELSEQLDSLRNDLPTLLREAQKEPALDDLSEDVANRIVALSERARSQRNEAERLIRDPYILEFLEITDPKTDAGDGK